MALGMRTIDALSFFGFFDGLLTNGPCWGKTFLARCPRDDRTLCPAPPCFFPNNLPFFSLGLVGPTVGCAPFVF